MVINMNVGGTEKSLLNLLNEISPQNYEVTLLMLEKYGGFLSSIPDWVNIEYTDGYTEWKEMINQPLRQIIQKKIKKRRLFEVLKLIVIYFITKIIGEKSLYYRYVLKKQKKIAEKFDIAVAYAGPMELITYFILFKIESRQKIQWIHLDIEEINFNKKFSKRLYCKFDKVFVVSNECKQKLINLIPSLERNTEVFLNLVPYDRINEMAKCEEGFDDEFNGMRILTVGRMSNEKGQDIIPGLVNRLIDEGYNIRWYCIGDGPLKEICERKIKKYNKIDYCIFLGTKMNPYPYMKECDIYIQTSRKECFCTTISEAKVFNRPIITTKVNGASELICHNKTGLIVSRDEEEIYQAIIKLYDNHELRTYFINNLRENHQQPNDLGRLFNI